MPAEDDDTTYTAGAGLAMTGTEIGVDFGTVASLTHTHSLTSTDVLHYFEVAKVIRVRPKTVGVRLVGAG